MFICGRNHICKTKWHEKMMAVNGHLYGRYLKKRMFKNPHVKEITHVKQSDMKKMWALIATIIKDNFLLCKWVFICKRNHICKIKWHGKMVVIKDHPSRRNFFSREWVFICKINHICKTKWNEIGWLLTTTCMEEYIYIYILNECLHVE